VELLQPARDLPTTDPGPGDYTETVMKILPPQDF